MTIAKTEDRRGFFRINVEVSLFYKKIDEKQLAEPHQVSGAILNRCSLATALEMMAQDSALLLHRLEKNLPDVAEYLKLIDAKIDLITQTVLMTDFQVNENDTRHINVSATGMAFHSETALTTGDYLEIKIMLISSMEIVVSYGRVVYCNKESSDDCGYPYVVGIDFINMKDEDREVLIKYVVKKQLQQIRDEKQLVNPVGPFS